MSSDSKRPATRLRLQLNLVYGQDQADVDFAISVYMQRQVQELSGDLLTREQVISALKTTDEPAARYHFFTISTHDGKRVGCAQLSCQHNGGDWEHSCHLLPEFWGRGYGTQVLRQLALIAAGLGAKRLLGNVLARNDSSRRMLEKAGFVFEGALPGGRLLYVINMV